MILGKELPFSQPVSSVCEVPTVNQLQASQVFQPQGDLKSPWMCPLSRFPHRKPPSRPLSLCGCAWCLQLRCMFHSQKPSKSDGVHHHGWGGRSGFASNPVIDTCCLWNPQESSLTGAEVRFLTCLIRIPSAGLRGLEKGQ